MLGDKQGKENWLVLKDKDDWKKAEPILKKLKIKYKLKEGLNEGAWTPAQTKAVDKVDNEFNKLMAKKGIEPYSVEASQLWRSAGFNKKMKKIFGKNESVNEKKVPKKWQPKKSRTKS